MKRKLKYVLWGILALLLIRFVVYPACLFIAFNISSHTAYYADFESYKEEFVLIKDYIAEGFRDVEDRKLYYKRSDDGSYTLFSYSCEEKWVVPDEVASALDTVDNQAFAYKDSRFDCIRIYGERISFTIENGQYTLTYSPEGRPKFVNFPDEDVFFYTKRLGDGWYHVKKINW